MREVVFSFLPAKPYPELLYQVESHRNNEYRDRGRSQHANDDDRAEDASRLRARARSEPERR